MCVLLWPTIGIPFTNKPRFGYIEKGNRWLAASRAGRKIEVYKYMYIRTTEWEEIEKIIYTYVYMEKMFCEIE